MVAIAGVPSDVASRATTAVLICEDVVSGETMQIATQSTESVRFLDSVTTVPAGLEAITRWTPSVVVVSERLFFSALRAICDCLPVRLQETRIALIGDYLNDAQLAQVLRLRISAILSRLTSLSSFLADLRAVGGQRMVIANPVLERLRWDVATNEYVVLARERLARLTNRQLEVLMNLANGEPVREIAKTMGISEKSIESHKYRIMNQLQIRNRIQLCRWAIREGLVTP